MVHAIRYGMQNLQTSEKHSCKALCNLSIGYPSFLSSPFDPERSAPVEGQLQVEVAASSPEAGDRTGRMSIQRLRGN